MDVQHSAARVVALIIDQNDGRRSLYAAHLALNGHAIEEASDGPDALVKVFGIDPDVIVAEANLLGIDRYHLCELLRRGHDTSQIPIVLMAGEAEHTAIDIARVAGADAVLGKPCSPDLLLAEIRRILAHPASASVAATPVTGDTTPSHYPPLIHDGGRIPLSHQHHRYATATPALAPPKIGCLGCVSYLDYNRSYVGGVNATNAEQWDYFKCPSGCGMFQYRHRTRQLRRVK
jgi:CheY-like chemotaxis protein